ncbi:coproporphyrinogen dehydrogenase HemZ [Anoxybacterium hadale]|uniref:coproporphyrinogen dehydrogenase HemZ n=1 Tax=Anoxybacterium hadale TaxID=3408580 RepID=UPI003AFF8AC7
MYKIKLPREINQYELEELVKVFLKAGEYTFITEPNTVDTTDANTSGEIEPNADALNQVTSVANGNPKPEADVLISVPSDPDFTVRTGDQENKNKLKAEEKPEKNSKNQMKRFLFRELERLTGTTPDWGILTGVRPVKLAGELLQREGSLKEVREILSADYFLAEEKIQLLIDIVDCQKQIVKQSPSEAIGLYIGIPFCPTRCVYCSFPSNQGKPEQIEAYLEALHQEIAYTAENMRKKGWYPETIYIGGGTPTTLLPEQLDRLLYHVYEAFDLSKLREFTVEAGRPDTITPEKLAVIKKYKIDRISINPQSMNALTLERIGRNHSPEDIKEAFRMARAAGIPQINTDLIAGLPDESEADFVTTLEQILDLAPENITIHTLALKRASKLKEIDSEFNYKQGKKVRAMLDQAKEMLDRGGFHPYYLYRQKQMTGNFENVGYAKENTEGIYNIRIMEEAQTIIALGAGGISKAWYPEENRLERIPNVSNYEIYIERLDEMLQRKTDNLFEEVKEC